MVLIIIIILMLMHFQSAKIYLYIVDIRYLDCPLSRPIFHFPAFCYKCNLHPLSRTFAISNKIQFFLRVRDSRRQLYIYSKSAEILKRSNIFALNSLKITLTGRPNFCRETKQLLIVVVDGYLTRMRYQLITKKLIY